MHVLVVALARKGQVMKMVHGLFCSLLFSRRLMLFLLCTPSPECEGCPRSLYRASWHRDWIFLIWFFSGFRWWWRVIHDLEGEKIWENDCMQMMHWLWFTTLLHYINVNYCQLLIAVDMMRRWKRPGALERQIPAYGSIVQGRGHAPKIGESQWSKSFRSSNGSRTWWPMGKCSKSSLKDVRRFIKMAWVGEIHIQPVIQKSHSSPGGFHRTAGRLCGWMQSRSPRKLGRELDRKCS